MGELAPWALQVYGQQKQAPDMFTHPVFPPPPPLSRPRFVKRKMSKVEKETRGSGIGSYEPTEKY